MGCAVRLQRQELLMAGPGSSAPVQTHLEGSLHHDRRGRWRNHQLLSLGLAQQPRAWHGPKSTSFQSHPGHLL
jgi:hypothetical protein